MDEVDRDGTHIGRVAEFDAGRGWGSIEAGDGTRFGFHCTQIADGSRSIAVGTLVRFAVRPAHHGQWEAADVVARRG